MNKQEENRIAEKSAKNISSKAYVWFEENWHHEQLPHTHEHYQLTYVEEGYQYFHIDQKVYFVPQNHVILIPSSTLHRTTSDSKSVILKVVLFRIVPTDVFYHQVQVFSAPRVLKEMLLYSAKWNKKTEEDLEQTIFLHAILNSLPHFYQENDWLQIPIPRDTRLSTISQYINKNYKYNLSTDELAEIAKMSTRTLQRVFKQETGITIKKYVQLIRILKSIELIDDNQYTLSEIAYRVGYKSLSAFTNSYATIMKSTPKQSSRSISE